MFQPLYLLAVPLLLCVAIPLTIFAFLTSLLAFVALLLRVSIVYIELALGLLQSWLFIDVKPSKLPRRLHRSQSPVQTQTRLRKHRKSSSTTSFMPEFIAGRKTPTKVDSVTSFAVSPGPNRDFEGVGGWRLTSDTEEDAIWMGLNSRLELPTERPRNHIRSLTSQSQRFTPSPEALSRSSLEIRMKTPPTQEGYIADGYFECVTYDEGGMSPEETTARIRMQERRKSIGSVSSNCSNGSTLTSKTAR